MYTYISTYTASLVFLFLYMFTWYIQSLLTRHMFLLMFVLLCVLSSSLGETHFLCTSTYQPTQRLLTRDASFCCVIYMYAWYIRSLLTRHMFLLIVVLYVFFLPSIFLDLLVARSVSSQETFYMYKCMSTSTRCTKCLLARDTVYVRVFLSICTC